MIERQAVVMFLYEVMTGLVHVADVGCADLFGEGTPVIHAAVQTVVGGQIERLVGIHHERGFLQVELAQAAALVAYGHGRHEVRARDQAVRQE